MGGKFCFFTDPALLGTQAAEGAFGPLPSQGDDDRFQCADMHSAAAGAPAVAICDGQVRAQWDETGGGLTLILKPDGQPPFDFPFISYFIYRGVATTSLLTSSGEIIANSDIELAEKAVAAHELVANGNTDPAREENLGLRPDPFDADPIPDDQPIDRLFYGYDPKLPPIRVDAGDGLGKFGPQFGLQIVVERMGTPPPLELVRKMDSIHRVQELTGPATAPNNAGYFRHWHDKEHVLDFIDPCAFWGAFFRVGLDKSKIGGRTDAENIYPNLLRGGGSTPLFDNHGRAYIDLRDEHGHSFNYYKAASVGPKFQLGLEDAGLTEIDYYRTAAPYYGWPCYWIDLPLPALPPDTEQVRVKFALPKTDYSMPLSYVSVGYLIPPRGNRKLRPFKDQERFISTPKCGDTNYLDAGEIAAPLVSVGSALGFAPSYQKISHFKHKDSAPAIVDPANLAPTPLDPGTLLLTLPGSVAIPAAGTRTLVKTFADKVLIWRPSPYSVAFVARPGFARDGANMYLFLFPTSRYRFASAKDAPFDAGPPVLQDLARFLPDVLDLRSSGGFVATTLAPAATTATPVPASVQLVHETVAGAALPRDSVRADFLAIAMKKADYDAALAAASGPSAEMIAGTGTMSLSFSTLRADDGQSYVEAVAELIRLVVPTPVQAGAVVTRVSSTPFPTLYGHEDL